MFENLVDFKTKNNKEVTTLFMYVRTLNLPVQSLMSHNIFFPKALTNKFLS